MIILGDQFMLISIEVIGAILLIYHKNNLGSLEKRKRKRSIYNGSKKQAIFYKDLKAEM